MRSSSSTCKDHKLDPASNFDMIHSADPNSLVGSTIDSLRERHNSPLVHDTGETTQSSPLRAIRLLDFQALYRSMWRFWGPIEWLLANVNAFKPPRTQFFCHISRSSVLLGKRRSRLTLHLRWRYGPGACENAFCPVSRHDPDNERRAVSQ